MLTSIIARLFFYDPILFFMNGLRCFPDAVRRAWKSDGCPVKCGRHHSAGSENVKQWKWKAQSLGLKMNRLLEPCTFLLIETLKWLRNPFVIAQSPANHLAGVDDVVTGQRGSFWLSGCSLQNLKISPLMDRKKTFVKSCQYGGELNVDGVVKMDAPLEVVHLTDECRGGPFL